MTKATWAEGFPGTPWLSCAPFPGQTDPRVWFSLGTLQHHLHLEILAPLLTMTEFLIFEFLSLDKGFLNASKSL